MQPYIVLREVVDTDLPAFYRHQADPEASAMAAFPMRERDVFFANWAKIRKDPTVTARAILYNGQLAGNIDSFNLDGRRLVGYWLGRDYWRKGIATRALEEFLHIERTRPLHALVAAHNVGSVRVLEKCGFVQVEARKSGPLGNIPPVDEFVMALTA